MSEFHALPPLPVFSQFYAAVNGRRPFPWQERLAGHVADGEAWPREVGVPTGLGKTACLDIAIWWLASQADRRPAKRTAPTRIWWLVNRRMLVDSTAEHADRIRIALVAAAESPGPAQGSDDHTHALWCVAKRLQSLSAAPLGEPLEVIRLRGGIRPRLPLDPSSPAVMLSTLPMFGSRLLFRSYGSSASMRPIEAALAGIDSLVLVDEAHLVRHLISLIPDLGECTRSSRSIPNPRRSRPQVVSLTATGDRNEPGRFDLDEADEDHPVVRRRLDATKTLRVQREKRDAVRALAAEARGLLRTSPRPATCIVFANTPGTARAVHKLLLKPARPRTARPTEVLMLTGRTREREAAKVRDHLLDPIRGMPAGGGPSRHRDRDLIVVATQTLEVGADLDAEFLVTETCGVRALTQRLGRLNRLGNFDSGKGVYVHAPPPKRRGARAGQWPVYGLEPAAVVERLESAASGSDGVDVSPANVSLVLGEPQDDSGRAPEILPGLLWEWIKTTTPPEGEAPVEPYFSGIAGVDSRVAVVWRAHVPTSGDRLWPRASDAEAVSVPIGEVRRALEDTEDVCRLASDRVSVEQVAVNDIVPGDVLVLSTDAGLLDEFGWDPAATDPVVDASVEAHGLPLDSEAIQRLSGLALGNLVNRARGVVSDHEDMDEADQYAAVGEILEALAATLPRGWDEDSWKSFVMSLDPRVVDGAGEVPRLRLTAPQTTANSDDFDETSLSASAIELEAHGRAVAGLAKRIAERLGLSKDLSEAVEIAGSLHDVGKADARFQRWLDPHGECPTLVAKSSTPWNLWAATRKAAGWPQGGRHEALSGRLVRQWVATGARTFDPLAADLLLHLVLSHHGMGRPLVVPVDDLTTSQLSVAVDGLNVSVPATLAETDWDQPARFRRLNLEFGPWGLALLEAILRRADHAVSSGADGVGANHE